MNMIADYTTRLIKKEKPTHNIYFMRFKLIEPMKLEFTAGQYMLLKVKDRYRQYSIASSEQVEGHFDLLVEVLPKGLASEYFQKLSVGENVYFKGPAGAFTLKDIKKDKIFLATGTGIAPIRSIIYSIFAKKPDNIQMYLYWGLRTKKDIYLFNDFKEMVNKYGRFNFQICLSQEKTTKTNIEEFIFAGRVNKCLEKFLKLPNKKAADFEYYICGRRTAVKELSTYIKNLGVVKDNIVHERFN